MLRNSLKVLVLMVGMAEAATLPFVLPWPLPVPITNSHPHAARELWAAIREIERVTPVRFVNRTDERDYADVVLSDENVVRNVAWRHNTSDVLGFCSGRSELHLKNSSGWLAMHELGHVLGLVHEHQASDGWIDRSLARSLARRCTQAIDRSIPWFDRSIGRSINSPLI